MEGGFGMKKEYRLAKNEDFQMVIAKRHRVVSKSFVIYYLPNERGQVRIGISVSSKIGIAVMRNKIKRQVRMMCQEIFNVADAKDFVLIIRQAYKDQSFLESKTELSNLYQKTLNEVK